MQVSINHVQVSASNLQVQVTPESMRVILVEIKIKSVHLLCNSIQFSVSHESEFVERLRTNQYTRLKQM